MILNKAIFSTIYLNLEQPNRYDINNARARNDAKSIFVNRRKYNADLLQQALKIYNEMQAKETEVLFAEWLAK